MSNENLGPHTTAVELRAPRNADTLEIDWADGHHGVYPHEVLRGFCPCAVCQGHQGPIRFHAGGSLVLENIEEIGNYALRLEWKDGHGTGLYSFRFLRDLCACPTCSPTPLEERSYSR
ncbi:MAG: DUF971 domain-containing protein [Sandaracinaceae bacterium]|nr:DUF971 domain-containing protein [Sandaracinaceae bacterium]